MRASGRVGHLLPAISAICSLPKTQNLTAVETGKIGKSLGDRFVKSLIDGSVGVASDQDSLTLRNDRGNEFPAGPERRSTMTRMLERWQGAFLPRVHSIHERATGQLFRPRDDLKGRWSSPGARRRGRYMTRRTAPSAAIRASASAE